MLYNEFMAFAVLDLSLYLCLLYCCCTVAQWLYRGR